MRTQRYAAIQRIDEEALTEAIVALASEYGRYAYLPEVIFESVVEPNAKLPTRISKETLVYYVGAYSTDAPNKLTALITVEDEHLVAFETRSFR